uniref:NAD-dependent protein deacetylase sirtuin-2 n=1 Tax=Salarias fasciatus TaxID=181472 RepID=A0A672GTE3_SALFA
MKPYLFHFFHLVSVKTVMDFLRNLFSSTLGLGSAEKVLDELTLEGVARYIKSGKCKNIICMVGAGISTSAGIPDFRSPGTGLYANLQKYNLPYPEAIFQIDYFKQHPEPFFALAKELYPGQFKPTICHYFIKMLKEKGLLRRCYSQNIDTLERVAGLEGDDLIEAHGTFYTSHCVSFCCRKEYNLDWMKEKIFSDDIPKCDKCQSLVKPDIVFFGENLPVRFFTAMKMDFPRCDLLIVMGTSLQVQPFAGLVVIMGDRMSFQADPLLGMLGFGGGMDFDSDKAYRDVAHISTCDDGCLALADLLGWKYPLIEKHAPRYLYCTFHLLFSFMGICWLPFSVLTVSNFFESPNLTLCRDAAVTPGSVSLPQLEVIMLLYTVNWILT